MDNRKYFIYITTNNINGCKYVGKHFGYENDSYLGSGKILKKAIKKYGKENFSREIIEFNETEEQNAEREKYYIALYDAIFNPMFYNIHEGGNGGYTTAGYTPEQKEELKDYLSFYAANIRDNSVYRTEEFKQKMSSVTSGKNNGMYGKHHTEETKQKMSQKAKERNYQGERNPMYGKKGEKALNGKAIGAFDEQRKLIHSFQTKQLALKFLNLKGHTGLDKAIKEQTQYKGYY